MSGEAEIPSEVETVTLGQKILKRDYGLKFSDFRRPLFPRHIDPQSELNRLGSKPGQMLDLLIVNDQDLVVGSGTQDLQDQLDLITQYGPESSVIAITQPRDILKPGTKSKHHFYRYDQGQLIPLPTPRGIKYPLDQKIN